MTGLLLVVGEPASRGEVVTAVAEDFAGVREAGDVAEACFSARAELPAAVIVDLPDGQPAPQSTAACQSLCAAVDDGTVPLVALAGAGDADQLQGIFSAGATDLLFRPWAPAQLRTRVRTCLLRLRLPRSARLAAVEASGLRQRAALGRFDGLAQQVVRTLGVPIALVTLVDTQRQVFVGQAGLDEPLASRRETPLSYSFCQHVAATNRPFEVADAREHPLVRDNPAVAELSAVAYAGVPLLSAEGETLGTVCAIDHVPHAWTDAELDVLNALAHQAHEELLAVR